MNNHLSEHYLDEQLSAIGKEYDYSDDFGSLVMFVMIVEIIWTV